MTWGEMARRMDAAEFAHWVELERIEPLPDPYWCAALICHVLESCWKKKPGAIADFLPRPAQATPRKKAPMPFAAAANLLRGLIAGAKARGPKGD